MHRRFFISTVALALSIILRAILTIAPLSAAQPNGKHQPGINEKNSRPANTERYSDGSASALMQPPPDITKSSAQQHEEDVNVQRQIAVASGKAARFALYLVFVGIAVGI